MDKQVITPAVDALASIRSETVATIMRGYGATRVYADALLGHFGPGFWMFEHNDKSEAAKPVLDEGAKFRKALKEAGHSNPSVAWTRVRKEAELLENPPTDNVANSDSAESEGKGSEVGTKNVRSIKLRYVEDLASLYKAGKREKALADDVAQALVHITSALSALGIDVATLK